jgi:hypothetical protein
MPYKDMTITESLHRDICALLSSYEEDLRYWIGTMDVDILNSITAGTPEFELIEDAKAYRTRIVAVLKDFSDA